MRNLRVLFLSVYDPYAIGSGPGTHLRHLTQSLSKLGCEVHVLILNPKNGNRIVNGVQLHYFNPRFDVLARKWFISSLISFREVNRLCREYKIDVVHGQSPSSFGYGLLRTGDIPFVVTLHGTSFGEIASYFDVPLSFINRQLISDAMLGQPLWAFLTNIEYKYADKIVAVSKAMAQEVVKFYRLPKEKVVTILNGVDLPSFVDPQVQEHAILFVGRLSWRKGVKYLIGAMPKVLSEYIDAKLLLVGDGDQRSPLQKQVKELGIESSVLFLGNVSAEELYSLYCKTGVYVQPSLYEPCGIAILEAMSMGKPVVSTRVGGVPELITNEQEGFLVKPGNSLELAKAIINVFSDDSCRRRLASNARKKVLREFSWEAIAKKTLELYASLLD